jgi:hypothetical protein
LLDKQVVPKSGKIQGTFGDHSKNIQGTFKALSGKIQGKFTEHSFETVANYFTNRSCLGQCIQAWGNEFKPGALHSSMGE